MSPERWEQSVPRRVWQGHSQHNTEHATFARTTGARWESHTARWHDCVCRRGGGGITPCVCTRCMGSLRTFSLVCMLARPCEIESTYLSRTCVSPPATRWERVTRHLSWLHGSEQLLKETLERRAASLLLSSTSGCSPGGWAWSPHHRLFFFFLKFPS